MAADPAARVYLDAEIRPYRSLSGAGFVVVMATLAGTSFIAGMVYAALGAWPVTGFFGLDVALVWIAFQASYRQARLVERVRITADRLEVERERPSGARQSWTFMPFWTRVHVTRASQVELVSHGRALIVGSFLAPKERARFAASLRAALAAAREERYGPPAEPQGSGGAP